MWELRVYSLGTDTSVGIVLEQGLGVDENKNRFDSGQTHATFCIDEGRKKNKVKLLQPDYRWGWGSTFNLYILYSDEVGVWFCFFRFL